MPTLDWPRLGEHVRARRVQLGYRSRDRVAELAGVGSRTLGDLERGQPVSDNTLWALEPALQWTAGSWKAVLRGEAPSVIYLATDPETAAGEATVTERNSQAEIERTPVGTPSLSVVPTTVEPPMEDDEDDEDSDVLRAIAADPNLDETSREHFTNQYKILRKFTRYRREHERLPYVAHGKREDAIDPEEEARIEAEARRAAQENPHSPLGKRPHSPDGDK